ncbi:Putative protein C11orf61 like protein [Chelonia mydas]|uniref:Myb/SANT-like DNA-binding domain-containing protein n=1 Tax=Chelonia mydas TaxID=8469 RepID=M7C9B4_CHEMY|nr:Putative protein C11orf61 like protein [Chelonia mydas]
MQASSAEVTMMESQNRKRAPAWTEREVRDLIAVWGEESVLSELRSSFRNAKTFVKISQAMKDRGHNRDPKQCRVKLKELRQAYQKTREANGRSGHQLSKQVLGAALRMGQQSVSHGHSPAVLLGAAAIRRQLRRCCDGSNSVAIAWGGKIGRSRPCI